MLTRNLHGTCKVPIGIRYPGSNHEYRSPTMYESTRGPMTRDCDRVQEVLLSKPTSASAKRDRVVVFLMTAVGVGGFFFTVFA